jgi:hypothetical protein
MSMLSGNDLLGVKNLGDEDIHWKVDGQAVNIPKGKAKTVPFDAVRIHLGDPRSGEASRVVTDGRERVRLPSRSDEYARLMTLYGAGVRQLVANQAGAPITLTLEDVAPKCEVTTIDGEKVDTVVSDPTGENPAPVELDTEEALKAQLLQLQRTQEATERRLRELEGNPVDGEDGEQVGEDRPGGARGRGKSAAA